MTAIYPRLPGYLFILGALLTFLGVVAFAFAIWGFGAFVAAAMSYFYEKRLMEVDQNG